MTSTAPQDGSYDWAAGYRDQVRLIVFDIDGVLTDGTVMILPGGEEVRAIHFHDLDAMAMAARRGLALAVLSAEATPAVQQIAHRFGITEGAWGAKDKLAGLKELTSRLGMTLEETCYVADADRDGPALAAAGFGLAPSDATPAARAAADRTLVSRGGRGVVAEVMAALAPPEEGKRRAG